MKFTHKIIDNLIANPTKTNLLLLNQALKFGIPFNAPHGFQVEELTNQMTKISLPFRKLNQNHLGGIHACAIATVGEFCAGLSILSSFGISKYRLILSELNVKYSYQGRVDLEGICLPTQINKDEVTKSLDSQTPYFQTLKTIIGEKKSNKEVAVVTTTWQIKSWDLVKTKN